MNIWVISPNWLAWSLLAISAISLCFIAWYMRQMIVGRRITRVQMQQQSTQRTAWHTWERAMTWLAFLLSIVTIAYLSSCGSLVEKSDFSTTATVLGILVTLLVTWNIYQVIDTKRSMEDVTVLRTEFTNIRRELDNLHQMHEAYVFAALGEDCRRDGNTWMGFDYFLRGAFIFLHDLEHYDLRFMSAISSMQTCVDDLSRAAIPDRDREKQQFELRRERILSDLSNLRQQAHNLQRFSEQAQRELGVLISSIENIPTIQTPPTPSD